MRSDHVGGCHCGALAFTFATAIAPADWSMRECQCSFCLSHGALYAADPIGELRFHHRDPARLVRYQFALRTADFLLCSACGVYIGAVARSGLRGIINAQSLAQRVALPPAQPVVYDGESEADRLARRDARWTPTA